MKALALDTATEVLGLAAVNDDAWASLSLHHGLQHSPTLLPLVERLLAEVSLASTDIRLIVCSLGPGSFTGIRIGLATAMGIGYGMGIPVVGVSTLDAIALPWLSHAGSVFPVIDARKGNIYTCAFRGGRRESEYMDLPPAALRERLAAAPAPLLAGPDAEKVRAMLGDECAGLPFADLYDPRALLRLGIEKAASGAGSYDLRPLYLRKSEAEITSGM